MRVLVWVVEGTWEAAVDAARGLPADEVTLLHVVPDAVAAAPRGFMEGLLGRSRGRDARTQVEALAGRAAGSCSTRRPSGSAGTLSCPARRAAPRTWCSRRPGRPTCSSSRATARTATRRRTGATTTRRRTSGTTTRRRRRTSTIRRRTDRAGTAGAGRGRSGTPRASWSTTRRARCCSCGPSPSGADQSPAPPRKARIRATRPAFGYAHSVGVVVPKSRARCSSQRPSAKRARP